MRRRGKKRACLSGVEGPDKQAEARESGVTGPGFFVVLDKLLKDDVDLFYPGVHVNLERWEHVFLEVEELVRVFFIEAVEAILIDPVERWKGGDLRRIRKHLHESLPGRGLVDLLHDGLFSCSAARQS